MFRPMPPQAQGLPQRPAQPMGRRPMMPQQAQGQPMQGRPTAFPGQGRPMMGTMPTQAMGQPMPQGMDMWSRLSAMGPMGRR
jgi:hypothetical protein